ncbi:uncharacterized protein LOC117115956 [Anneissia japonica]|uniref:uncharacterized protein LOC117115956 n=1 Tax=Anneissia japonica TaxID=1529436 RepID=UPI0014258C89|nr:uncharacterized protein LOC117115956 [Anneissia japonica]
MIKSMLRQCIECQRWRKKAEVPVMADLPNARLRIGKPAFYSTGVDCFGPMNVKVKRSTEKRWGVVFKCMTTWAVHLEVIESMNMDAFLMAFQRFVSRRGKPKELYSDCGTNFKGAEKELCESSDAMSYDLRQKLASQQVKFNFNPPGVPHFGGIWEREVRSIKNALRCSLNHSLVTDVVLRTVFTEAESVMNSKPLGYASSDIAYPDPITPNMLLMGRRDTALPLVVFNDGEIRSKRHWRHSQFIAEQFWRRFMREYLPSLQIRQKWHRESCKLKVGDVVLIIDSQQPRAQWLIGKVTTVYPGEDGRVRVAEVLVNDTGKTYKRPVAKLVKLEQWKDD